MFSLREIADGKFIYRCHQCGWESEITTTEQRIATEQAIAYSLIAPMSTIHCRSHRIPQSELAFPC